MSTFKQQLEVIRNRPGFITALDQSGGRTPKALAEYGIDESEWKDNVDIFEIVHQMRTRIMKCRFFNQSRIVGAILFEDTFTRTIEQQPTAEYL